MATHLRTDASVDDSVRALAVKWNRRIDDELSDAPARALPTSGPALALLVALIGVLLVAMALSG
ncbi:MAG: hypothetical protein HYX34_01765 [Actinobacteria bacterium]|nr:hypothetical protein [Actinomycetota bacterium]